MVVPRHDSFAATSGGSLPPRRAARQPGNAPPDPCFQDLPDDEFDALFGAFAGDGAVWAPTGSPSSRGATSLHGATGPAELRYRTRRRGLATRRRAIVVGLVCAAAVCALVLGRGNPDGDRAQFAGVLAPMPSAPTVRWSVPVTETASVVATRTGVVLADRDLVAYRANGTVAWQSAQLGDRYRCLPRLGQEIASRVVCISRQSEDTASVVTVDPATGAIGRPRQEDATYARELVDGDLIRIRRHTGLPTVARVNPATGAARWTRTVHPTTAPDQPVNSQQRMGIMASSVERGIVTVYGAAFLAAFTADGTPLPRGQVWTGVRLPDGRVAGSSYGDRHVTVFSAAGTPDLRVLGRPLEPALHDESADAVMVVNSFGSVTAVNAKTGATLWQTESNAYVGVARIGGVIVVRSESDYQGLDLATGQRLWDITLPGSALSAPMSDGRSVMVSLTGRHGHGELVALDVHTGEVVWRVPLPAGAYQVCAVGGQIYALTSTDVVAMR